MTEPSGDDDGEIRVLCVDSVESVGRLAAERLERENGRITTVTAGSASDALGRLGSTPVDCVVSEHQLQGRDGVELRDAIRPEHPELPFVLFTAAEISQPDDVIADDATAVVRKDRDTPYHRQLAERVAGLVAAAGRDADGGMRDQSNEPPRGGLSRTPAAGTPASGTELDPRSAADHDPGSGRATAASSPGSSETSRGRGYIERCATAGAGCVSILRGVAGVSLPPGVEPTRHLAIAVAVIAIVITAAMGAGVLGVDSFVGGGTSMDASGPDRAGAGPPVTETPTPTTTQTPTARATRQPTPTPTAAATSTAAADTEEPRTATRTRTPLTPRSGGTPTKTPGPTLESETATPTSTPTPTPTPDESTGGAETGVESSRITPDDGVPV